MIGTQDLGRVGRTERSWQVAQWLALALTALLLAALVASPDAALGAIWYIAIPLLPLSFLVSPSIWRNICPLATLNLLASSPAGRTLGGGRVNAVRVTGIVLLFLLVPARHFLFNTSGTALAIAIGVAATASVMLGHRWRMKAGFCNAICPVLPVERLYGQSPLLPVINRRCPTCVTCTPRGCVDLAPTKSIAQTLGRARRTHAWLQTDYGIFAAVFPGFVLGYGVTRDVTMASWSATYLTIAGASLASYVTVHLFVRLLRIESAAAMRGLAAVALLLYYGFTLPAVGRRFALPSAATGLLFGATAAFVLYWFWRAGRRARASDLTIVAGGW